MNILGIDFEDWYHPELIKKNITSNEKIEPSVIQGIDKILDWLRKNETLATFFIVGELLEFRPEIFDKIIENGHEIGFHTMHHTKLDNIGSKEKFTEEIKKFEQLTKKKSKGFRAPTFSLNQTTSWAIDVLQKNNYMYDRSVVPAKTDLYGLQNAKNYPNKISSNSLELLGIPTTTISSTSSSSTSFPTFPYVFLRFPTFSVRFPTFSYVLLLV